MQLRKLKDTEREHFIIHLQKAFRVGVESEFGSTDEEAIPREDIENSIDAENAQTFVAVEDEKIIGGCVVEIHPDTQRNTLSLLYVDTECHNKGVGFKIWNEIERMFPDTKVWETCTPYFDRRNIHFYVNKCKFHITEFFHQGHQDPNDTHPSENQFANHPGHIDCMFYFEKEIN